MFPRNRTHLFLPLRAAPLYHKTEVNTSTELRLGGENLERLYTCEEVAQRYGVKLITVWDWIRKKKLPAIKTGKRYSIRPQDIEAFGSYLDQQRRPPPL